VTKGQGLAIKTEEKTLCQNKKEKHTFGPRNQVLGGYNQKPPPRKEKKRGGQRGGGKESELEHEGGRVALTLFSKGEESLRNAKRRGKKTI